MRLFYTTTTAPTADQPAAGAPATSLGGYRSATPVPNDETGNLWPLLAADGWQGRPLLRCLALVNTTTAPVSGATLTLALPEGCPVTALLGIETPTAYQGTSYVESATAHARPLYTELQAAPLALPELAPGAWLGLWVRLAPIPPPEPTSYPTQLAATVLDFPLVIQW